MTTQTYWINDIPGMEIQEDGSLGPNADTSRLAGNMTKRINEFANWLTTSGKADRMRRSANLAYGMDPDSARRSTDIPVGGDQGNLFQLRANAYRRLTEAAHVLVTGSRPAWSAGVSSSDSTAVDSIPICNEVLDHALTKRGAEDAMVRGCWNALLYGEGHVSTRWDEMTGQPLDVGSDGRIERSGDVLVMAHRPDEVVRDTRLEEQTANDWVILVGQANRYDLATLYPDYEEEIVNAISRTQLDDIRDSLVVGVTNVEERRSNGDQVTTFELFHRQTPAVPNGLYALMVGDTIVAAGKNKYAVIPVSSMIPDKEPGQPCGYSSQWDLMALQQAMDSTLSSLVSTTENLGQPSIWALPGSGISVEMIGGFRFVETATKPEPLAYVDPQTIINLSTTQEGLYNSMVQQSGLNSVATGDVGSSASGDALAMMHSLAIQSTSRLQAAYARMFEQVMFNVILRYRTFATDQRIVSITGKGSRSRVKRWVGSDLAAIDSIKVEMRAAIMRTATGRAQIAEKWATLGLLKTTEQYMEVLTTGSLSPITDGPLSERGLIEWENEQLAEGMPVQAVATDTHPLHILEHTIQLYDPDIRRDRARADMIAQHIQEHTTMWGQVSAAMPDLLAALKIPPAPSSQMMMGAPPQGGGQNPPEGSGGPPEPAPPNEPAKLEEANIPPGGGMDAGANEDLTGGGRLPTGTGQPVMA